MHDIIMFQCEIMPIKTLITERCCEASIAKTARLIGLGKLDHIDPRLEYCYSECSHNPNPLPVPRFTGMDPDDPPMCECGREKRMVYKDGIDGKRKVYCRCKLCNAENRSRIERMMIAA